MGRSHETNLIQWNRESSKGINSNKNYCCMKFSENVAILKGMKIYSLVGFEFSTVIEDWGDLARSGCIWAPSSAIWHYYEEIVESD